MRFMTHAKFAISAIAALLLGAIGCGLIDTDITKFTFKLPSKKYAFVAPNVGTIPSTPIACGAGTAVPTCLSPLTCDDGICTGHAPVSVVRKMDFRKDAAELTSYASITDLKIESIKYTVVSTANIEIPTIEIFLAPDGVTDPASPNARKFGSIPPIAAGETRTGQVVKEADADAAFSSFATNIDVPFNFIATTTVVIPTGSPTPTGMVDVTIDGMLSATPMF
jgi:hypothetical protein